MLSFFRRDVLAEIWDLIGSVSEGFPTYFLMLSPKVANHLKALNNTFASDSPSLSSDSILNYYKSVKASI